jgi:hypothetical protein
MRCDPDAAETERPRRAQRRPDRRDAIGAMVCLIGAGIILFAPRAA